MESGWDGVNCTSKEAAAEISTGELLHCSAHLCNHKEETEIKMPFGIFLDLLMLKGRDGVAFQSLNVSILGEHLLSAQH